MNGIFFRLTSANIKRLKSYIPSVLIAVVILLSVCSWVGSLLSDSVYKDKSLSRIGLAYYMPQGSDDKYINFSIAMLEDMDSMKSTLNLIRVNSIEEGYDLLESGEVIYYIILPKEFFTSIIDGTNPPIDIVVKDNSKITSYIVNEIFMSYASYLGVSESAVYSAYDVVINHKLGDSEYKRIQYNVNYIFFDRALNKEQYLENVSATNEGSYTLTEHYLAVAVMLTLFFLSFILLPMLQGYGDGMNKQLMAGRLNGFHIFLSNFFVTVIALYIAYLPCFIRIEIVAGQFNAPGLITILPWLVVISLIINIVSSITKQSFSGNMCILIITLLLAYIGGGIMPEALLPHAIQDISTCLPGKYIISGISHALFN